MFAAPQNTPQPIQLPRQERAKIAYRWVYYATRDEWFNAEMPASMRIIARAFGYIDAANLVLFLQGVETAQYLCDKILDLADKIKRREAVFIKDYGIYDLMPEPVKMAPPVLKRVEWRMTSTCSACGNNQYLPAMMNGEPHALCYHCIKPDQYAAYGAKKIEGDGLISSALEKMGVLEDIRIHQAEQLALKRAINPPKVRRKKWKPMPVKRVSRAKYFRQYNTARDKYLAKRWS